MRLGKQVSCCMSCEPSRLQGGPDQHAQGEGHSVIAMRQHLVTAAEASMLSHSAMLKAMVPQDD